MEKEIGMPEAIQPEVVIEAIEKIICNEKEFLSCRNTEHANIVALIDAASAEFGRNLRHGKKFTVSFQHDDEFLVMTEDQQDSCVNILAAKIVIEFFKEAVKFNFVYDDEPSINIHLDDSTLA